MDALALEFVRAHAERDGKRLALVLSPPVALEGRTGLRSVWRSSNFANVTKDARHSIQTRANIHKFRNDELTGWVEVVAAYWRLTGEVLAARERPENGSQKKVYEKHRDLATALIRGYTNHGFEAWTVHCLYIVGKNLRNAAIHADIEIGSQSSTSNSAGDDMVPLGDDFDPELEQHKSLRDAEQVLKRMFTLCLSDRSPLDESRKWGIYYIVNLLFKAYFKLNSAALSRTLIKAINAYQGDMPQLASFPAAQRVTYKYYEGVLSFLEENYADAERHLQEALDICHHDATTNQERIFTYLIPCKLLTSHTLPSISIFERFPRLQQLFSPVINSIRRGNLQALDVALEQGEEEFVRNRIYLTLERGRDIALRNLLRFVFLHGGFDEQQKLPDGTPLRRTRIPVAEFQKAINFSGKQNIDADEVECLLANMVAKGLMKGYISRERGIVVLSKSGAFPGTNV